MSSVHSSKAGSDRQLPAGIRIHEQSLLARVAAWKLNSPSVAMVIGNVIHLWGISRSGFLAQPRWVRHELAHVRQYQRFGIPGFLIRYLWFSFRYGYTDNPLEREARASESS